jgi:chemotaxis signal transduction protein
VSEESQQREYFGFSCADQYFAFPADVVRQAVSPGQVTSLPFVPTFVEGLVSVGDRVLPQIDLTAVLFPEQSGIRDLSEVLVLEARRAPLCVRVGVILGRMQVDARDCRDITDDTAASQSADLCQTEFSYQGHSVLVLDVEQVAALVAPTALPQGREGMLGGQRPLDAEAAVDDTSLYLLSRVGSERYVLPLTDVLEVIDQARCAVIPGAPHEVEGLALIRGELLLVLDLAALLGVPRWASGTTGQLMVIACDQVRYGLRVEAVEDIVSISQSALRPLDDEEAQIAAVAVYEDQVFAVLDPARLISSSQRLVYRRFAPADQQHRQHKEVEMHQLLHVRIHDDDYALPLDQVQRVAEYFPPESLSDDADGELAGVANIGGDILPVVNIAKRLGVEGNACSTAWIVIQGRQGDVAMAVDQAYEIVSVPVDRIDATPGARRGAISAIVRLEDRLVSLLDSVNIAAGAGSQSGGMEGRP